MLGYYKSSPADDVYQGECIGPPCACEYRLTFCLGNVLQWVNLFPEIKPQLVNIFERYRYVLDAELQQRACEYLALTQRNDEDELLQVVCEEMPPFPERESALVSRLHSKADSTQDKRTWVIGGKDENKGREAARFRSFSNVQSSGKTEADGAATTPAAVEAQSPSEIERDQIGVYDMMGADPSAATDDVMTSLAGLDMGGPAIQEAPLLPAVAQPASAPVATSIPEIAPSPATAHISTAAALAAMSLTKGPGIEKVRFTAPTRERAVSLTQIMRSYAVA